MSGMSGMSYAIAISQRDSVLKPYHVRWEYFQFALIARLRVAWINWRSDSNYLYARRLGWTL